MNLFTWFRVRLQSLAFEGPDDPTGLAEGEVVDFTPLRSLVTLLVWMRARLQNLPFEGSGDPVYLVECEVAESTF